jgi:hypothetical protein
MGGGNPIKNTWDKVTGSSVGQIAVPIVAGYVTGGLATGGLAAGSTVEEGVVGAAGQKPGAVGAAAGVATAGAIAPSTATAGDPLAPPDMATVNDPSAVDRALRHKQRLAAAAGRGSTFLTGSQGLGGDASGGGGKSLLGL